MNIGIDIDDTIVSTARHLIKYADMYVDEVYGKKQKTDISNVHSIWYLREIYGFDINSINDFFEKYYKKVISECEILPNVSLVLNKLKNEGHIITFITARTTKVKNCDTYNITCDMLNKNNIPYDNILFDMSNKLDVAKKNNIDIMIDDCYDICFDFCENGIKALLMNSEINCKLNEDSRIKRVSNWNEIYEIITKEKF